MAQEPSSGPARTSRRDFVKRGVAAAAVPVLAPLAACASTPHPEPDPAPSSTPPAASAQPVAPSATPAHANEQQRDPVSVHLTEALKARYRDRLTDEQWEEVRKGVEGNLRAAKALHDLALPVQTEPAFVFRAYRAGER
jgi:pyruvate/2-oxoglutarate dehydrogenase complex dihydrolipoamide acyltransferase (E2) component